MCSIGLILTLLFCTPVTKGSEIEHCDGNIQAEVERVRDAVAEKGRALDNDRDRAQKAADKNLLGFCGRSFDERREIT